MQIKTISTAAGVNEIDFGNDNSQSTAHFYWLKNLGDSILYVSANPNPIAEKDDVAELPAKGAVSVETDEGKIYVLGAGKVEIHRTNSKFCPFEWQSSGSGGGGTIDAYSKTESDAKYASKALYGDTTINVGRKAETDVGEYSTAEGYNTTASGASSHAEGSGAISSRFSSHAEGVSTTASATASHAEGGGTIASGIYSHSEGYGTTASGEFSHAGGHHTQALKEAEFAHGKFNQSNEDTIYSIGDGTADDARHNAFEITTTGGKLHDKEISTTPIKKISFPSVATNAGGGGDLFSADFGTPITIACTSRGDTQCTPFYYGGNNVWLLLAKDATTLDPIPAGTYSFDVWYI